MSSQFGPAPEREGAQPMRYTLWLDDLFLGSSDLEHLDDGMGVMLGRFFPERDYGRVEAVFRLFAEARGETSKDPVDSARLTHFHEQRDSLPLSLRNASGKVIAAQAITVLDYRPEGGDDCIELEVILSAPLTRGPQSDCGQVADE